MSLISRIAASSSERPLPEFVASSTNRISSSTNTVTAPSGIQDGDLLVALVNSDSSGQILISTSGFSLIAQYPDAADSFFLATKIATSESGNYTFTWSSINANTVTILVYRNATCVNVVGTLGAASTSTPIAGGITPTYKGVLCAFFAAGGASAKTVETAPSGMTLRASQQISAPTAVVYDQSPQDASPSGNKILTWTAGAICLAILFQITNEPIVAPNLIAIESTSTANITSTLTINKPAGTIEGDLMIAVMGTDSGSTTWTGDTDWIEIADLGTSNHSLRVAYKIAGTSEGLNYTFTYNSSRRLSGSILTYRNAAYDKIGSFGTGANPIVIPSITLNKSQSILIAVGMRSNSGITLTTPIGMSALVVDNDTDSPSYIVCDQIVPKGPTGTRSTDANSSNGVAGIMLAINPTRSLL